MRRQAAVCVVVFLACVVACSGPTSKTESGPVGGVGAAGPSTAIQGAGVVQPGGAAGQTPAPVDWSSVGNTAVVGDVKIELLAAFNLPQISGTRYGKFAVYDGSLFLRLRLTNQSKVKIARYESYRTTLTDEHGNRLKEEEIPDGFGFANEPGGGATKDCELPSIIAASIKLDPAKCYVTYLMFEKAPAVSKEARLSLPGRCFGGTNEVRLRTSITEPRP